MTIEMEQQRQCCAMEASTRSATAAMPGTQVYHPPAIHPTAECAHQPPRAAGTTEPFGDRQQCRCYREGAWDIREDRFYTSGTVSASFFMWCVLHGAGGCWSRVLMCMLFWVLLRCGGTTRAIWSGAIYMPAHLFVRWMLP